MSPRYAPLPSNPHPDLDAQRELDDAFDDSDDEADETRPLTSTTSPSDTPNPPPQAQKPSTTTTPTYDFENADYDFPPPGSPPRPSASALPNEHGNSNGLIPSFDSASAGPRVRTNWFQRLLGRAPHRSTGTVGGGGNNDGVFANVTAKPSRPMRIREGDETYVVPEDARAEAPPSYSSAQADAVPSYWETTVHVPFSSDSSELIIDSLPTGSLFSFLWNMLISVSFQFIGFLLTYLLHTTHAARLGSRAGLGITLIQYGFALRNNRHEDDESIWGPSGGDPVPTFATAEDADAYAAATNRTMDMMVEEQASMTVADATTEWLSFFLMTVGWFILLTSLLGFWRVKRWERGIVASQLENPHASDRPTGDLPVVSQLERVVGFRRLSTFPGDFFRHGFGLPSNRRMSEDSHTLRRAEEGTAAEDDVDGLGATETDLMIPEGLDDESRLEFIRGVIQERRLQEDLRAAGFL